MNTKKPFVGGKYGYDIFISYVSVNNGLSVWGSWVDNFIEYLKAKIEESLLRQDKSSICTDFDKQAETALKSPNEE